MLVTLYSLPFPLLRNHSIPCYSYYIPCPSLSCGITEFPFARTLCPALPYAAESLNSLILAFYFLPLRMLWNHSVPCYSHSVPCHPLNCEITQFPVIHTLFPVSAAKSLNSLYTHILFPALPSAAESLNSLLFTLYSLPSTLQRNHSISCHSTSIPCLPVYPQFPGTQTLFHSILSSSSLLLRLSSLPLTLMRNRQSNSIPFPSFRRGSPSIPCHSCSLSLTLLVNLCSVFLYALRSCSPHSAHCSSL